MIGLPAGTRVWLAAGVTDMRNGVNANLICPLSAGDGVDSTSDPTSRLAPSQYHLAKPGD